MGHHAERAALPVRDGDAVLSGGADLEPVERSGAASGRDLPVQPRRSAPRETVAEMAVAGLRSVCRLGVGAMFCQFAVLLGRDRDEQRTARLSGPVRHRLAVCADGAVCATQDTAERVLESDSSVERGADSRLVFLLLPWSEHCGGTGGRLDRLSDCAGKLHRVFPAVQPVHPARTVFHVCILGISADLRRNRPDGHMRFNQNKPLERNCL